MDPNLENGAKPKKCKQMHFGKNNKCQNYHMNDPLTNTKTILSKFSAELDLGINITTNRKSTIQSNKEATKANNILGLVNRDVCLW